MNSKESFLEKVSADKEIIGIIGLGYVGLPLAVCFAEKGIKTIGFDPNSEKVGLINEGKNYIGDIRDAVLRDVVVDQLKLSATTDFSRISKCDALIICVPTPLDRFKKPDMSFIESASETIAEHMSPGTLVSLESTTYPTTTEHVILPILSEKSGLEHGKDFWLAYSPERVDPGNEKFHTQNTPKVLGALGEDALEIATAVYKKAISTLHPVSSPRVAEMVKILENTYRLINISLINELALLSGKMGIDIWEVIDAAKTKPFGFQAFYPGPGIGGHCIPLDPFYLEHIAKEYNFDLTMIHTAGHINMRMPHYMYIKIATALNKHKKAVNGSKVLFVGVAYKANINDGRESPALEIMDTVAHKGGEVSYHDPFIAKIKTHKGTEYESKPLNADTIVDYDCVVLTTNHSNTDMELIESKAKLIVDLKNMVKERSEKVYKL